MAIISAAANISVVSSALVVSTIKFSTTGPDTSSYRAYLILDNKPLTNHGRILSENFDQVFTENTNWNKTKSRYYRRASSSGKRTFSISWSYLPGSRYNTVDKRYSRDYLKSISSDPGLHILKIVNNDESGVTPYTEETINVFISDYSEELIRRDFNADVYYWNCTMGIQEA